MRDRWNWGVFASQVPWMTSASATQGKIGDAVVTRETSLFREIHREISGAAIYPFSSAKRLEFTVGLHAIGFASQTRTAEFSGTTGGLLNDTTITNPADPTLLLGESHAALVYDTSLWGPTSPILGKRYRFAVSPTFGGLNFTDVTADFRQYWMPVRPFTIAVRVMHLGRYGTDANDPRLLPLVWTVRDVVRGYGDYGAGATGMGSLAASRILVGNGEVRFPLAGLFTKRRLDALPIEGLVFSDFGRFWGTPSRLGTTSPFLRSVGAGARLNAAGLIFEFDAVQRFDAQRGWSFSFNFRPGF